MTIREHYIFICNNRRPSDAPRPSCQAQGSLELFAELKRQLAEEGLAQRVARCCQSSCLDLCDHGPVVLVEPEHWAYGHVRLEDVSAIVQSLRTGQPATGLLIEPNSGSPDPGER